MKASLGQRGLGAVAAAAAAVLAGCAAYHPEPLQSAADEVLSAPSPAALSASAASLDNPRLKPIALDFSKPLTPDELAVIAVVASPDLKAARTKAGVAEAQAFSAGLLPDPQVTLGYDQRLSGPDPYNGWAAQIAADLNALRERRVTLEAARAANRQVRLDIAWQEWQTAEQAKLLAARIGGLERALELARVSSRMADAALARALAAAARGDLTADEVEARRIAVADEGQRLRQSEKDLDTARHDLNKLLGLPPELRIAIAETAPPAPALDAQALFERARRDRLDLQALQAGYASQEANVRKAVMDQFPALQLTINRAQDTANNQTVGPQVSFTLPVWNRNRGGIAIAKATREQLRAEYAARVFATRADIAELVSALEIGRRQAAELSAQAAPLARIAAESEAAARRGDILLATAETARQSLIDKQIALAAADQAIAEQTIGLEIAVGAPLQEGAE